MENTMLNNVEVNDRVWAAKWISNESVPNEAASVYKKEITLDKKPKEAKVYICGVGFYVLNINGKRVGDDILQPAFSNYDTKVYYNVYDISDYLKEGNNIIKATVGNGWYNEFQPTEWYFENAVWRDHPKLIAEFFADGSLVAKTDLSWRCRKSPTVYNSLRGGETFDNSLNESINDKDGWNDVMIITGPTGIMKEQTINPIKLDKIIEPVRIIKTSNTDYIYDFGTNVSGNAELSVDAPEGAHIVMQYTERLRDEKEPDLYSISHCVVDKRFQLDFYIAGKENAPWHGEFSYHGFRYVRVMFAPGTTIKSVKARMFHTVAEDKGGIETDNKAVSTIQAAIKQSFLTNLHHMPTDCPHREKNGWAADGYLSSGQALLNFDVCNVFDKWVQDFVDCQKPNGKIPCIAPTCGTFGYGWGSGPSWDLVLYVVPWNMYMTTGDINYLKKYFTPMGRYIDYLETITDNGLCSMGLGEWCAAQNMGDSIPDPVVIQMSCFAIYRLYKKIADAIGNAEEAKKAEEKMQRAKDAFIASYGEMCIENQLYYAGRLYFDLFDNDKDREKAKERLVSITNSMDNHIYGGIFTAYILPKVLTDIGRFDIAYDMATKPDYPGWLDMIDRAGGTLGEEFCGGPSLNHHMFSTIGYWFYTAIAGINLREDAPGFKAFDIKPNIPDDINNFKAWHQTPYGKAEVNIQKDKIHVVVPKGTSAKFVYKDYNEELTGGEYSFER